MGESQKPQKLNPDYYYLRRDLLKSPRLHLVLYLWHKYGMPMTKAQAPAGYEGKYSFVLQTVDDVIDHIWDLYREEGMVGKKTLLKKAPRDPAFATKEKTANDEPPEEEDEEKTEDPVTTEKEPEKKPKEEITNVEVPTTKKKDPAPPPPPEEKEPEAKKTKKKDPEPPAAEGSTEEHGRDAFAHLVKALEILPDMVKKIVHEEVDTLRGELASSLIPALDAATDEREQLRNNLANTRAYVKELRGQLTDIQLMLHNWVVPALRCAYAPLSVLVSDLRMAPGAKGLSSEELVEAMDKYIEVLSQSLGDEYPVEVEVTADPEEEDAAHTTVKLCAQDDSFIIRVGGKDLVVNLESLQDETIVTEKVLHAIAGVLGLEIKNMPRVRALPIIWDALQATR